MMDRNKHALEMAQLGKREHGLMQKLLKVQARRCELLCEVARSPEAGLSDDVVPTVIEPKDQK